MMNRSIFPAAGRQRGRSKLALFALVLLISVSLAACNWELNIYRVLATTQNGYESYWRTMVQLHDERAISEHTYVKAKGIADRIFALGKDTTALMVSYQQIKTAESKAKINAAVLELPRLVAELAGIVAAIKHGGSATLQFEQKSLPVLERMEAALAAVEELR